MIRKLVVVLLTGVLCLVGITSALAVKYNEAPMLRARVAAGELPRVQERLPENPLIVEPIEEIGQYGGTLNVLAVDSLVWCDMQWGAGLSEGLYRLSKDGSELMELNLAKGYKFSEDYKHFTIYLREGVKWSDGMPLTADDVMFWLEDMITDPELQAFGWGDWLRGVTAKRIDDYTVELVMDEPFAKMEVMMSLHPSWTIFQPKHYLKKWHIKYNAEADKLAKEEGFANWREAFEYHYYWVPQKDVNRPVLNSWVLKETTTTHRLFERNPYYWKVDTAGNQLPYIDRLYVNIIEPELYSFKVITGEADYAYTHTSFDEYPLYKENETQGNYRMIPIPGVQGNELVLAVNLNHPDDGLRKIFQDVRFRRALSLAINREEIHETLFFGLGVPLQATVSPDASYYKKEWGEAYIQYDPGEANRLLDEMGLMKRDKDGFRIGPDGKTLLLIVDYRLDKLTTGLELIKEYWDAVGVKVLVKLLESSLFMDQQLTNKHMVRVVSSLWFCFSPEVMNYFQGYRVFAGTGDLINYANIWGRWIAARLKTEKAEKKLEAAKTEEKRTIATQQLEVAQDQLKAVVQLLPGGEEPPEDYQMLNRWVQERDKTAMGSERYMELSEKIHDFHAENLYLIGTVGLVPRPWIASNKLGNVITEEYLSRAMGPLTTTGYAYQFFFKGGKES